MTEAEAEKIFGNWQKWYWPCFFHLQAAYYPCKIPESFLPYSKEEIEKALTITAEKYLEHGDLRASQLIRESGYLCVASFANDEEALDGVVKTFSNPDMRKATISMIKKCKEDWNKWVNEHSS